MTGPSAAIVSTYQAPIARVVSVIPEIELFKLVARLGPRRFASSAKRRQK